MNEKNNDLVCIYKQDENGKYYTSYEKIYLKQFGLEFTKSELEKYWNNGEIIIFKYNNVYQITTYSGKDGLEFGLHEIRQLKNMDPLPYTKRGRFCVMNCKSANSLLGRKFFIEN